MNSSTQTQLEIGAKIIRSFAKSLPATPGVYRMLDSKGGVLYVGKAKALSKRVMSYTNTNKLSVRIQRMVAETKDMEFVHTQTESEALLYEADLIKKLYPRYNILLRDDKSFPYIMITGDHDFPLLKKHRGAQKQKGDYFGPFPGAGSVNRTITTLYKAFMLRNCTDNVFNSRTRPCLQYHIKRCTAPCVGEVSKEEYAGQVKHARDFLSGKSQAIQEEFAKKMQKASDAQDYEEAAKFRDRLKALTMVQSNTQNMAEGIREADVVSIYQDGGRSCVQIFFFRAGHNFGNNAYYPLHKEDETAADIISAVLGQFYCNKPAPKEIIVNIEPTGVELIEQALNELGAQRNEGKSINVKITVPQRGQKKKLTDFAANNAKDALAQKILKATSEKKILQQVADLFELDELPNRIEVYDNSHISGTHMTGGMIVAGLEGFRKNAYRKFNIKQAEESDDFGMMREVLYRRFSRALKEDIDKASDDWPDLVVIDGGKGQLSSVRSVLEELGILDDVKLVAIAKGPDRNAGREVFYCIDKAPFDLPVDDPTLHYMQRLRDEAHRFAIGAHRTRRSKAISASPLDDISGIGAARKKALLHYFGSAKAVSLAAVEDLQKVEGISQALAEKIYSHFH